MYCDNCQHGEMDFDEMEVACGKRRSLTRCCARITGQEHKSPNPKAEARVCKFHRCPAKDLIDILPQPGV